MRKVILILITTLTLSCCNKDGVPFGASDQLPPETQTGANSVGCLVNGKVFLPKAGGISPDVNCFYQLIDGEYFFAMGFSDLKNGIESVGLFTARINLEVGQTYILNQGYNPNQGGGGEYFIKLSNKYNTNSTTTGELRITKLDPSNSIISGTFWFDAVNAAGEKVEIRQGRFDWRY
jgi:hypothetical protein